MLNCRNVFIWLIGILSLTQSTLAGPQSPDSPHKVALYSDRGASSRGVHFFSAFLRKAGIAFDLIDKHTILGGSLTRDRYAVLIMPGGKSWHYVEDLIGKKEAEPKGGDEKIRAFVDSGGGYIGICAGAFLATRYRQGIRNRDLPGAEIPTPDLPAPYKTYEYGIGLLDGIAVDGESMHEPMFHDGMQTYQVVAPGLVGIYKVMLLAGPSFSVRDEEVQAKKLEVVGKIPPWSTLASTPFGWRQLSADLSRYDDAPVMVGFQYGKGRVFLSGPHLEYRVNGELEGFLFGGDPESDWPILCRAMQFATQKIPSMSTETSCFVDYFRNGYTP